MAFLLIQPGNALAVAHDKPGFIKLIRSPQTFAVLGMLLFCAAMAVVGATYLCCLRVMKEGIGMAKDTFSKRKDLLCGGLSRIVKKRIIKAMAWSVASIVPRNGH